eukprot:6368805-Pyramimonas_sp.AAC.1
MQKYLSSSEHPRAQDIMEGGLWTDPPSAFWNGSKGENIRRVVKQVFTRSFVTAQHPHRWRYQ